jgi:hypothetical protein
MWEYAIAIAFFIWLVMKLDLCDGWCVEAFSTKPNHAQVSKYTSEMLTNKQVFSPSSSMTDAKTAMPWIDPIIYEDARELYRKNKLSTDSISKIFH